MGLLNIVNIPMAALSIPAYVTERQRVRALLHSALIAVSIYVIIYVWVTPSLDW